MTGLRSIRLGDYIRINTNTYSLRENWEYVNYLDTGNITENRIDSIQHIILEREKLPNRARRKVKKNNIIYSTVRPNQRHFGFIECIPENFLVSTGFAVIEVDEDNLDPKYIYYMLAKDTIIDLLQGVAEQSTTSYPSINPSDLEDLIIRVPALEHQKRISYVLSIIDKKIDNNTKINDNLAQYTSMIYDYWFTQFDFPNEKGKPYKSSGGAMTFSPILDKEIPDSWSVVPLGNIAKMCTETISPQTGIIYKHYSIPAFDDSKLPIMEDGAAIDSSKYLVPTNAILVSKLNPQFKRVWLVTETDDKSICSTEFLPFCNNGVPIEYLYGVLNSAAYHKYMIQCSSSSTGSRKRMPPELCLTYNVVLPPKIIMDEFSKRLMAVMKQMSEALYENEVLRTTRAQLLPLLMSGQTTIAD